MSKNSLIGIIILGIILLVLVGGGLYLFVTKTNQGEDLIDSIGQKDETPDKSSEYYILYGRTENKITSTPNNENCKNFSFSDYLGAGIIDRHGKNNNFLSFKNHLTNYPSSKLATEYYYTSTTGNPKTDFSGFVYYDWNFTPNTLYHASPEIADDKEIKTAEGDLFPSDYKTSEDNKYLAYLITEKDTDLMMSNKINAYVSDSKLVLRNTITGDELSVFDGEYNRQLFSSFNHFSQKQNYLYTIARDGESFKLVAVSLDNASIKEFNTLFPKVDWSKINWSDLFEKPLGNPPHFYMSPDEKILLVYKNKPANEIIDDCYGCSRYTITAYNTENGAVTTYDEGDGLVESMSWAPDSSRFAYTNISYSSCYPGYLDAMIYRMDSSGKNKTELITEKESKILRIGWSPDNKLIGYGVYSSDLIGWIKTIDPDSKKTANVISTKETEGKIDTEYVITLNFLDWVKK